MVAQLRRPRGNRGELAGILFTGSRDRFNGLSRVYLKGEPYDLETVWYHKEQPIFKFRGVDSISAAEQLAGLDVCVPASERVESAEGEYFFSDLVGCTMLDVRDNRRIGVVKDWQETGGPVLLEVDDGGPEPVLVPFAAEFLKKIDVIAREIRVELPPGLLDLNR